MVTLIVIINTSISISLLYIAWRLWQWRQRLTRIADILIAAERSTHAVLNNAPTAIYMSRQNLHNLRQGNQSMQLNIQQLRQIFGLLALGSQAWRRNFWLIRAKSLQKRN